MKQLLQNIAGAILSLGLLASCSQDELAEQGTPLPVGQYPLELTAGGLQAVATPAQPTTRGTFFEGDWDGVTSVRVRVNDKEEKEYKVEASEGNKTALLTPAVPLEIDDELFWWTDTNREETKTVMAWAPYEYKLNDNITLPAKWEKDDFTKYDVIGVRQTIGFEDRNEPLGFQHLMAKVVINLRRTDYLEKAEKVDVQLIGMHGIGSLKINSNQLEVSHVGIASSSYVTPYQLPAENYEEVNFGNEQREIPFASYTALVVPINSMNTRVLQIDVDEDTYLIKKEYITNSLNVYYEAGQVTTFNITVKENKLDVAIDNTASISWDTDGATGSGNVELP